MCEKINQNTEHIKGYLICLASCKAGSGRALWATFSRDSDDSFILNTQKRNDPSKGDIIKSTKVGTFHS